ncbi:hypothetical protein MRX96_009732 [Rhipicephalus microplus]
MEGGGRVFDMAKGGGAAFQARSESERAFDASPRAQVAAPHKARASTGVTGVKRRPDRLVGQNEKRTLHSLVAMEGGRHYPPPVHHPQSGSEPKTFSSCCHQNCSLRFAAPSSSLPRGQTRGPKDRKGVAGKGGKRAPSLLPVVRCHHQGAYRKSLGPRADSAIYQGR